ncbi:hypothetical protein PILCRDRAFT_347713 [Piloderma croceum F 1598]|uniref:Uncharacterized protein n=1 Tax=Piloderma croceum (strain F 1598) TaxID=765440 RepID=A0A0C3G5B7_PILCF|nr:hypothetical protein PILCRDRAFT_347713 [Piloderma croceum F 1598]
MGRQIQIAVRGQQSGAGRASSKLLMSARTFQLREAEFHGRRFIYSIRQPCCRPRPMANTLATVVLLSVPGSSVFIIVRHLSAPLAHHYILLRRWDYQVPACIWSFTDLFSNDID